MGANRNIAQLVEHPAYIRNVPGSIPGVPIWILFILFLRKGTRQMRWVLFLREKIGGRTMKYIFRFAIIYLAVYMAVNYSMWWLILILLGY